MNPMDNPVGEANIAFLEEVLKQMEQNIASQEVKIVRNKCFPILGKYCTIGHKNLRDF